MYKQLQKDIKIASVEFSDELIDIGAAAAKAMQPCYRYRYARKHTYVLVDGQRVEGQTTGETKPKLAKSMEREQKYIAEGCMFCSQWQDDKGIHWGTVTKVTIGLR
jgi:hypothetical protein